MSLPAFHFKRFSVAQAGAAHPVGTDAVLLGAWTDVQNTLRFLDIGTGTGVVALMLAQRITCSGDFSRSNATEEPPNKPIFAAPEHLSDWNAIAVEIHPPSAALARTNFAASPWASKLDLWEGPIQGFPKDSGPFDLIVSNPPFFSDLTVSPDQDRSLGRHTASLSPGDLLATVNVLLAPKGRFCVVLPEREGRRLCEFAVPLGLYWTRITEVRSRPGKPVERLLLQFEKNPYAIQREEICLFAGKTGQNYSPEFQALTRDFYLAG